MIKKILKFLGIAVLTLFMMLCTLYLYNTQYVESKHQIDNAPTTTHFTDIGGEQIAYSEVDNKAETTVIFVGGLSSWNGTWERVITELNKKVSTMNYIAVDLPPFGYSIPDSKKSYYRGTQSQRIASFVESKHLKQVIMVGHSYGAGPVTEYVLNNEARVKKLIIIDGVLNIDEIKSVSQYSPVQSGAIRSLLIGALIHNDRFAMSQLKGFVYIKSNITQDLLGVYTRYLNTEHVTYKLSAWLKDYINDPLMYASNNSKNYRNLTVPVRIIWGDKDTITPIGGTEVLLKNIPDVRLYTLPGVGHIPMIEDYKKFDTALVDALQN